MHAAAHNPKKGPPKAVGNLKLVEIQAAPMPDASAITWACRVVVVVCNPLRSHVVQLVLYLGVDLGGQKKHFLDHV